MVFVFPLIILAVIAYFNHAMSEAGARLEPEQLLQNIWVVSCTAVTAIAAIALLYAHKYGLFEAKEFLHTAQ